jgi:mono/diheme cytochrome c family protein
MKRLVLLTSVLALALLASPPILAAEPDEAADRGEFLYRIYCRSCHGAEGAGDGPMAEVLKVEPADLSRLAERAEGEFRSDQVYRKIDGREDVRGHGSSEMPVWGLSFQSSGLDAAQEVDVRSSIQDLVAYLASIQSVQGETEPGGR